MSESQIKANADMEAVKSLRRAESAHVEMATKLKTYREGLEAALQDLEQPGCAASEDSTMADGAVDQGVDSGSIRLSSPPSWLSPCSPASDTAQGEADSPDASDVDSSSSGSSWVDYDSSRCPSVMSTASSRSFPDDAFVFPIGGRDELGASWISCFKRFVEDAGPFKDQELYVEYPVHEPVPDHVRSIPFEAPSKNRLVRAQNYEGGWVIVTETEGAEADARQQ